MRSLGLDIGDKRTGVAISDPQGILAVPLNVVNHQGEDAAMNDIIKLVGQYEIERIVIGLPYYEQCVIWMMQNIDLWGDRIKFDWIPREMNLEADELSKKELLKRCIEVRW